MDIKWTNYLGDPYYETNPKGRRVRYAYEKDDSVHRCMKKGTARGNFFGDKTESPGELKIDEYRTFYRYSGPRFKCSVCGHIDDLARMKEFHINDEWCKAELMKKFFKEKPTRNIPVIDKDGLDKFI